MPKSGIYKIESSIKPERIYIGSAKNLSNRKSLHFGQLNRKQHCNIKLQRHYDKYENDLKFVIIIECEVEDLIKKEQEYIDLYNPYFNICKVAGSSLGRKGGKMTEENKRKLLEINKGNNYGSKRIWTDEQKLEVSIRKRGTKHTQESKDRISESNKGKTPRLGAVLSEETKRKISESKKGKSSWNKGIPFSEETKEKMKQAWMKRRANVKVVY